MPVRIALVAVAAAALCAGLAQQAAAKTKTPVRFTVMNGFPAPGTPSNLNRVGVLKMGDPKAKNVLVLNPGTSAGAGYFEPIAKTIAKIEVDPVPEGDRRDQGGSGVRSRG